MTSETDYSIRRTTGTREIAGFRPVANEKDKRRRRRRDDHEPQPPDDRGEEEAVHVDLTEPPDDKQADPDAPEPAADEPADDEREARDHEVDYLA